MKEQILELRSQGKTYNEIKKILGCSKSTIAYHCGEGQKNKTLKRQQKRRSDIVILNRVANFQYDRRIKDKAEDFQRERFYRAHTKLGKRNLEFTWKDVIDKFGWETTCYLTGRKINLREPRTYQFDHIVAVANGGTLTIDNLGICCRDANQMKHDLTVDNLLALCVEMLEYNGYQVQRRI